MNLNENQLKKLRVQVLKMKGKPFILTLPNGRKQRIVVKGIRGNQVAVKATGQHKKGRVQQFGFDFLLPLLFFAPFFFGGGFGGGFFD